MENREDVDMEDDDLMFGGMDMVVDPPLDVEEDDENVIRVTCEKEFELYLKTPGIALRKPDGSFADPLVWWEGVEKAGKFPILCQLVEIFLAIPATSAPLERIWSRSAAVLIAKRSRMSSEVASCIMFLKENTAVVRENMEFALRRAKETKTVPIYLPKVAEEVKETVDVGQDLFSLKF